MYGFDTNLDAGVEVHVDQGIDREFADAPVHEQAYAALMHTESLGRFRLVQIPSRKCGRSQTFTALSTTERQERPA